MNLKYGIAVAALFAICASAPAFAASSSSSNSAAGSASFSNSTGTGGNSTSTGVGYGGTGYGGASTSTVNYTYNDPPSDPNTTSRVITTGVAVAPSLYTNNVCALQASAAGGFLGGAFSFGFDRIDHNCDTRANAALLGHFAEINSIEAEHAPDPQVRAAAANAANVYATWANNYICMQNPDLAAAAPPGSGICVPKTQTAIATVVPVPATVIRSDPVVAQKPSAFRPVATSYHTGPISGYNGPDYQD